jgi:hypothetical protein
MIDTANMEPQMHRLYWGTTLFSSVVFWNPQKISFS